MDMWKTLSAEEDEERKVDERRDRYLAFVDYLGTEKLYQDAAHHADDLVERRNELEHGIHILLQPFVASNRIEIGVFSDTVLIAGRSLPDVVRCSSLLIRLVFTKSLDRANRSDMRLLRGGFAKGIELRTSYLRPGPKVHVIPFFDGSLAFTYHLEGVRKGSRLFFPATVGAEELGNAANCIFPWKHLSGMGDPTAGIHEFMWPAYLCQDAPMDLAELVRRAFTLWRQYLAEGNLTREEYRETLYHFDETIKCLLRSFISLVGTPGLDEAIALCMKTVLPHEADLMEDCDIRYVWGFWFQAMLVIVAVNAVDQHEAAIALTKKELVRRSYFDKFMAEAEYPDYEAVRSLFKSLE